MDLEEFKTNYYLFDPKNYGRIFVFVDFGNVRAWAKDLWPKENKDQVSIEIDIEKISQICNLIKPERKFFYYGHFKSSDNFKKHKLSIFRLDKARENGFLVKTKEIKMVPNYDFQGQYLGKYPKCNFDVEITMTALQKIEKYDTIMLFSGDSDFSELLKYLKSKNKKIIIICTRNRMSKELEKVADIFIPAESLRELLPYVNKNNTPPLRAEE